MTTNEVATNKHLFKKGLILLYAYIFILLFSTISYVYNDIIYAISCWGIAIFLVFYSIKAKKIQKAAGYLSYDECLCQYGMHNKRNMLIIATIILAIFTATSGMEISMNIILLCGMAIFIFSETRGKKSRNRENREENRTNYTYFIFCAWLMNKNAQRAFIATIIMVILTILSVYSSIPENFLEMPIYTLSKLTGILFICSVIDLL